MRDEIDVLVGLTYLVFNLNMVDLDAGAWRDSDV
jgi:hypothetical protein